MIIAIDGPAASGKGTLAKLLARHYGLSHLDTGSLYRAVARDVLAAGGDPRDERAATEAASRIDASTLDDPALRGPGVGEAASYVAKMPPVRRALVAYQRSFAQRPEGVVIEGRDIGTVVCPDADVKLFVTATPEVRAARRHAELAAAGHETGLETVLSEIRERDARDTTRAISPLLQAEDAYLLDTSNLDIETAFKAAVDIVDAAMG